MVNNDWLNKNKGYLFIYQVLLSHRLLLCRGVRPLNKWPGYDSKQSDGEVPVMLGNAEYPFIAITPRSVLARVVAPDRFFFMGQIELNCVLM